MQVKDEIRAFFYINNLFNGFLKCNLAIVFRGATILWDRNDTFWRSDSFMRKIWKWHLNLLPLRPIINHLTCKVVHHYLTQNLFTLLLSDLPPWILTQRRNGAIHVPYTCLILQHCTNCIKRSETSSFQGLHLSGNSILISWYIISSYFPPCYVVSLFPHSQTFILIVLCTSYIGRIRL